MSLASAWSTRTVLWLLSKQTSTSLLTCWKKVVLGDLGESCFFIHSNHNKLLERAKHLCFTPYIIVCSSVMIKYIFLLSKPNVNDINMTVTNIYSTGREPMIVKLQWRLEGVSFSNAIFARAGSSFHLVWWLISTIDSPVAAYLEFESDMVWVPHGLLLSLLLQIKCLNYINVLGLNKNAKSMRQLDKEGWQPLLLSKLSKHEGIKKCQEISKDFDATIYTVHVDFAIKVGKHLRITYRQNIK